MINSFCQSDRLWNEGEDRGLRGTGQRCSHTEGRSRKKQVERMRREEEIIHRDVQGDMQEDRDGVKVTARVRKIVRREEIDPDRQGEPKQVFLYNEFHSRR